MNTLLGEIGEYMDYRNRMEWSELAAYDPLPDTYQFLLPLPPATLNDVQFPRYRLAFKFRKLQKSFLCKLSISAVLVLAKY